MSSICNGYVRLKLYARFGNQLFTYLIARIFAEKHNLNLQGEIKYKFLQLKPPMYFGEPNSNLKTYTINDNMYKKDEQLQYNGEGIYIFDGLFQYENIFFENKEKILSYFDLKIEKKSILSLHIRLDDYYDSHTRHLIINTDYYIDCIKKYCEKYDDVYIICDVLKKDWEKTYMNTLINKIKELGKNPIYNINSVEDDLTTLINSETIITSNSTFCFWASFLSDADKIIAFPYTGVDVCKNGTIKKWGNDAIIFKYRLDPRYIYNFTFRNSVIEYFEQLY